MSSLHSCQDAPDLLLRLPQTFAEVSPLFPVADLWDLLFTLPQLCPHSTRHTMSSKSSLIMISHNPHFS